MAPNHEMEFVNTNNDSTPLHSAAKDGNLELVRLLVETSPQGSCRSEVINAQDNSGKTALDYAIALGHADIVRYFLEEHAEFGEPLDKLLRDAAYSENEDVKIVEILLNTIPAAERDDCVNAEGSQGETPLHVASAVGNCPLIQLLITAGARVDVVDHELQTPLICAAAAGHLDAVKLLVNLVDGEARLRYINMQNRTSYLLCATALQHAIMNNHEVVVSYLIEQNADMGMPGETLRLAVMFCQEDEASPRIVKIILDAIPEADRAYYIHIDVDDAKISALQWASALGNVESISMLVRAGGKLSAACEGGKTVLMLAASEDGNYYTVEHILDTFDETTENMSKLQYVNLRDNAGLSALDYAKPCSRTVLEDFMKKVQTVPIGSTK